MASNYISPISMDALSNLCQELGKNNYMNANDFERYQVKRGLRNSDGTGVMAGLTRICSVEGYYILDGERIPTVAAAVWQSAHCQSAVFSPRGAV